MRFAPICTFTLLAVLSTGAVGVPLTADVHAGATIARRDPQLLGGLLSSVLPPPASATPPPPSDDDDDDAAASQPEARWLVEEAHAASNVAADVDTNAPPAERRQGREKVASVDADLAVPPTFASPSAKGGASGAVSIVPGHKASVDTKQHASLGDTEKRQLLGVLGSLLGPGASTGGGASD